MSALEQVLPELAAAWDRRRLVPFVGAGTSVGACPSWRDLLIGLGAGVSVSDDADALIRAAHDVTRRIRRGDDNLQERTRKVLYAGLSAGQSTGATDALADTWWPLILTTNYDDLLVRRFAAKHTRAALEVLGRSERDCLRVWHTHTHPSSPAVWALQGFLPRPRELGNVWVDRERLARELVLGHAEYRRATYKAPHFRRTFGHLYHSASFLFVGFGLRDPYVLDLFGEVVEMVGRPARPHYALLQRGEVDVEFLRDRFGIHVIEYPEGDFAQHVAWLSRIGEYIGGVRPRPSRWSYASTMSQAALPVGATVDVDIVRAKLPGQVTTNSWTVLSGAQTNQGPYLGTKAAQYASGFGWDGSYQLLPGSGRVAQLGGAPDIWALVARSTPQPHAAAGIRTLAAVGEVMAEFLDHIASLPAMPTEVRFQLLAAGGGRSFPPSGSLIRMLQSIRRARERHPSVTWPVMRLYIVDPEALGTLECGRVDIAQLLGTDAIRVAIEIDEGDDLELHYDVVSPQDTAGVVAQKYRLAFDKWRLTVSPGDRPHGQPLAACSGESIESLGATPGSMLRFSRDIPGGIS